MSFDIISIVSIIIALVSIIIVIWDHFKDDRLLTRQVQKFYDDIEHLIYYYIKKKTEANPFHETERRFYAARVEQDFDTYARYLGLARISGTMRSREYRGYISKSDTILISEGRLDINPGNQDQQFLIKDYKYITESDIKFITTYLQNLRAYWKDDYHKFFFRPNLKARIDFKELIHSLPFSTKEEFENRDL